MTLHRQLPSGNLSVTLIVSGVILIIGSTFLLFVLPRLFEPPTRLLLGEGVFNIQLALNSNAREKGLSGKPGMEPGQALLMAFPSDDKWAIWMKDMNFPIDIVWLNKDKKVVYIVMNVSPDNQATIYRPNKLARYVVELPGGTVSAKAINVGNIATFDISGDVN